MRGHHKRGAIPLEPLPSPREMDAMLDAGDALPEPEPEPEPVSREPAEEPAPDPEPAHGRREWGRAGKAKVRPGRKPTVRLSASMRGDIRAKIGFGLEIPGRLWQARDPVCGGAFVEQRDEITDALTEIVCQSADLVEWFTSTGGGFMLALNLGAACWPVVMVVMAHHVYHSIEDTPAQRPDLSQYAA